MNHSFHHLQPDIILKKLERSLFAANLVFRKSLDSTNSLAKDLAEKGAPEGTVVLAEEQRAGKGRMGRRWFSPGYRNLLFSILLRPNLHPEQIFVLTMILALAAIEAVKERTGLSPMIKWPNDLYVARKKLAGILTEFSLKEGAVEYVVLGLGLNVNWNPDEGEKEISRPGTSILAETGIETSRNDLLIELLRLFEDYYLKVLSGRIDDVYKKWNELSLILGREVEIESPKEKIQGKALRIDHHGALIIQDHTGKEKKILSGDVSLRF